MLHIDPAAVADCAAVAALERACFSVPWSEEALIAEVTDPACVFLVCREDTRLLGYVVGRRIPPEAELYRIAVSEDMRGSGIGGALLRAYHEAVSATCDTLFLEVRASNAPAISLYEKEGYRKIDVRPRYYRDPVEDALIFRRP